MEAGDIPLAVALITKAMNRDEGRWAEKTMLFHFKCQEFGLADGREYYIYFSGSERVGLKGMSGLHHYEWGPEENVWLAWFAVDPAWQGQGLGRKLMALTERKAIQLGYQNLLIETYNQKDFEKARNFYSAVGFKQKGKISGYLPDGSEMIVYGKRLCKSSRHGKKKE